MKQGDLVAFLRNPGRRNDLLEGVIIDNEGGRSIRVSVDGEAWLVPADQLTIIKSRTEPV